MLEFHCEVKGIVRPKKDEYTGVTNIFFSNNETKKNISYQNKKWKKQNKCHVRGYLSAFLGHHRYPNEDEGGTEW